MSISYTLDQALFLKPFTMMILLFGISLICWISLSIDLLNHWETLLLTLNSVCTDATPPSKFAPLYSALVCGTPLPPGNFRSALQTTGIIHIIVVSGAHLLFLEAILFRLLPRHLAARIVGIGLLALYCLITKLQPPVVRAFLAILIGSLSAHFRLAWPGHQRTLLAGCLSLVLFPQWVLSLSLILSWTASLALSWPLPQIKAIPRRLLRQSALFGFLFVPLLPLAPPHPLSILINWMLVPLLGGIVFPISLLVFFLPFLHPITDFFWQILTQILSGLSSYMPLSTAHPTKLSIFWCYLLILQALAHFLYMKKERP